VQSSIAEEQAPSVDELTEQLLGIFRVCLPGPGEFFEKVEALGLSFTQLKLLQFLGETEHGLSLGALGEHIGLSLPAVSRAVEGLVKRGLLRRAEDPHDRRSKQVRLTAKGRRVGEELLELRAAGLRDFVGSLTPEEQAALTAGLRAIERRLPPAATTPTR
jgi:DNA-binding MarR family transcriptional regulator